MERLTWTAADNMMLMTGGTTARRMQAKRRRKGDEGVKRGEMKAKVQLEKDWKRETKGTERGESEERKVE